jgi:hypothetical protein
MDFILTQNANGDPVYAVEVKEMVIFNPHFSDCGRFAVNPITHYGLDPKTVSALAMLNAHFGYCTDI